MALDLDILHSLLEIDGGTSRVASDEQAYTFCEGIARSHYENFPVGSLLIESSKRPAFYAIYAYSRFIDDIADQLGCEAEEKVRLLTMVRNWLSLEPSQSDLNSHPIFRVLWKVRQEYELPQSCFERLIEAFVRDSHFQQPANWDEVLEYCSFSANPVGELLLRLYGDCDSTNLMLSDKICTALQLINFWQDFSRDLPIHRIYLPRDFCEQQGIDTSLLVGQRNSANFPSSISPLLTELANRTEQLMREGSVLVRTVRSRRLSAELSLIVEGGLSILSSVRRLGPQVLQTRPKLTAFGGFSIAVKALLRFIHIRS